MQKKNRNILPLSDCNVTPKYPYNAIKGYEGSIGNDIGNDIGNFRLHTIGRGIIQFFYVTCSVLGESTLSLHQYFFLYNLFLLSKNLNFSKKSCIPSSYFISLPSVVGQRRLSGLIILLLFPHTWLSVNSQGVILQYFLPVSLTYGFFIGFDEILKESLCSISFIFPISQYILKSSTWHWI